MSTDYLTQIRRMLADIAEQEADELKTLRAENRALRSALAKAEQAVIDASVATVNQLATFDQAATAAVVSE